MPLACGCIGQETTGAGGFAKAMRTVPVVLDIAEQRRRRSRARRVDRRLHEPGRDRHARAARRRPPRGRPVQRRDRASSGTFARLLGVEPARVRRRPGRPQPPDLGARGAPRRRRRAARAARRARRRARRRRAGCRAGCSTSSGRCRPTTCTTSTRTTRCWPSSATARAARRDGGRDRARAAGDVPRPVADGEAGAARAARRRVLQRGGGRARARRSAAGDDAVHEVDMRNGGTLAGLADDDVVEVPARVGRDGPMPLEQAPLAPELLGPRPARRGLRAADRRGGGHARRGHGPQGAARAPADRPARDRRELYELSPEPVR